jgi:hypothetical protein
METHAVGLGMQAPEPRFGGRISESLDRTLTEAAQAYRDKSRAEGLLLQARERDPDCLPVYFALYKFYIYSHRLHEAERVVEEALHTASRLGNFPRAWQNLTRESAAWDDVSGPEHFYLFSLKALAFIRLRLGRAEDSAALLRKLAELESARQCRRGCDPGVGRRRNRTRDRQQRSRQGPHVAIPDQIITRSAPLSARVPERSDERLLQLVTHARTPCRAECIRTSSPRYRACVARSRSGVA